MSTVWRCAMSLRGSSAATDCEASCKEAISSSAGAWSLQSTLIRADLCQVRDRMVSLPESKTYAQILGGVGNPHRASKGSFCTFHLPIDFARQFFAQY